MEIKRRAIGYQYLVAIICLLAGPRGTAEAKGLQDVANKTLRFETWKKDVAFTNIEQDLEAYIRAYDEQKNDFDTIIQNFRDDPVLSGEIIKVTQIGQGMAKILENLPTDGTNYDLDIYLRLVEIATWLSSVQTSRWSFVEGKQMRGWPVKQKPEREHRIHEAYVFGNIATTVALGARAAAIRGQDALATQLLKPVLEALYDNWLTGDKTRRKTDAAGRYALVPKASPKERFERFRSLGDEQHCLDTPEAYGQGTTAARAAIACHKAIQVIDWSRNSWPLFPQVDADDYMERLFLFIRRNGNWLRHGLSPAPSKTGDQRRDSYKGEAGTEWYTWKHRDLTGCSTYLATERDRPGDIMAGGDEMAFVADFVSWAQPGPYGGAAEYVVDKFTGKDIRALIVTFLNRLIRNPGAKPENRFACDIHGTMPGDSVAHAAQACEGKDAEDRPGYAATWLGLALAARRYGSDQTLQCDAYRMVETVLPLALEGNSQFYPHSFSTMSGTWTADLLVIKYFFYNFRHGLAQFCNEANLDEKQIEKEPKRMPVTEKQSSPKASLQQKEEAPQDPQKAKNANKRKSGRLVAASPNTIPAGEKQSKFAESLPETTDSNNIRADNSHAGQYPAFAFQWGARYP